VVKYDADASIWQDAGDEERVQEVGPPVRPRLGERDLGTGHRDRLAGVGEEESEDTGCVCLSVDKSMPDWHSGDTD